MNKLLTHLLHCFFVLIYGFILFTLFFRLNLFSNIEILFYRGISIAILTLFIQSLSLFIFFRNHEKNLDLLPSCLSAFFLNIAILIVVPVTLDRSVSMFILAQFQDAESSITSKKIENILIRDYIIKNKAVERRLKEQIKTGNLTKEGNYFSLSKQGQNFIKFSVPFSRIFRADTSYFKTKKE